MSTSNSTAAVTPIDAGQANLELAESLREVASWLEMHAGDLPLPGSFYTILTRSHYGDDAREVLTAVARALGDRAQEKATNSEVTIYGHFGPANISVGVSASLRYLGGEVQKPQPPAVVYEPILKPAALRDGLMENALDLAGHDAGHDIDPPVSDAEDEAFAERGWRESRDA